MRYDGTDIAMNVMFMIGFLASVVFFCSMLTGCQYVQLPHQREAAYSVWEVTYYDLSEDPPPIRWVFQQDLDCSPDRSGQDVGFHPPKFFGALERTSYCVGGETYGLFYEVYEVQLAAPDGKTFSETAFAHELYHAFLHYRDGDGDDRHSDPGFGIGYGHLYGLVDAANDALRSQGL